LSTWAIWPSSTWCRGPCRRGAMALVDVGVVVLIDGRDVDVGDVGLGDVGDVVALVDVVAWPALLMG